MMMLLVIVTWDILFDHPPTEDVAALQRKLEHARVARKESIDIVVYVDEQNPAQVGMFEPL